jgi:hypothetical protein
MGRKDLCQDRSRGFIFWAGVVLIGFLLVILIVSLVYSLPASF